MLIVSDSEVIRRITRDLVKDPDGRHPRFACYFGAGASTEAGVPTATQICYEIRRDLRRAEGLPLHSDEKQSDQWDIDRLDWHKPTCYMTSMRQAFGNAAERVEYFRAMLKDKSPSFSHHALALLIRNRYFKSTCLTTNFDKLIETAFMQQDFVECQPIRNDDEAKYWVNAENRHFVIKLHGDYDTDNILNTANETVRISDTMFTIIQNLLDYSGLVVIGTAGNEKSVHTMFDTLVQQKYMQRVLRFGLYWGVYVGPSRPENLTQSDLEKLVEDKIKQGEVGQDINRMIREANGIGRPFHYFPVWGASNFLFDLVKATDNPAVIGEGALYLDHEMRLRHVFSVAGLSDDVISDHIALLAKRRKSLDLSIVNRPEPEEVFTAEKNDSQFRVRIIYGDISSRSLLGIGSREFGRVAVVSPEDTCISAGGGAAYQLLVKAGKQYLLNELAKLAPIQHCQVAVTSGGKLPAHYIFHTAAIEIREENGKVAYMAEKPFVCQSMKAILEKASTLEIDALYVPLLGTGVAGLDSESSLEGILEAIRDWDAPSERAFVLTLVIYRDKDLERYLAGQCLSRVLSPQFTITRVA